MSAPGSNLVITIGQISDPHDMGTSVYDSSVLLSKIRSKFGDEVAVTVKKVIVRAYVDGQGTHAGGTR